MYRRILSIQLPKQKLLTENIIFILLIVKALKENGDMQDKQ